MIDFLIDNEVILIIVILILDEYDFKTVLMIDEWIVFVIMIIMFLSFINIVLIYFMISFIAYLLSLNLKLVFYYYFIIILFYYLSRHIALSTDYSS